MSLPTPKSLFDGIPDEPTPAVVQPAAEVQQKQPKKRKRRQKKAVLPATEAVPVVIDDVPEVNEVGNPEDAPFATLLTDKAIDEFQNNAIGIRLRWVWIACQRVVGKDVKAEFAEEYSADLDAFGIFTRLWPSENSFVADLRAARSAVDDYWRTRTLAGTEKGTRVVHKTRLDSFWAGLKPLIANVQKAAENLKANLPAIVAHAESKLGELFKRENYPLSADSVTIDCRVYPVPMVPPNYLLSFAPGVYADAQRQFQEETRKAALTWERELAQQLGHLVSHLCSCLVNGPDGESKIFRDSSVENIRAFFREFRELQLSGDTQLSEVVNRAEKMLKGIEGEDLRNLGDLRSTIRNQLSEVRDAIANNYLVDVSRKRRNIIRERKKDNGGEAKAAS